MEAKCKYFGEWQSGSTILQKLDGPIGEGRVEFPNGDKFEGYFYLSFAYIHGPCYDACGKYTFADGTYIERAWISTGGDIENWGLLGVFEVLNPDGSLKSIASFVTNKRQGIEVIAGETPEAIEWSDGEEIQRYPVKDFSVEKLDRDRTNLNVSFTDGKSVKMIGGKFYTNQYDQDYFKTGLKAEVFYPDGSSFSSYHYRIKGLEPVSGTKIVHLDNGKQRIEKWKDGSIESSEEEWDESQAITKNIPNPISDEGECLAKIWKGHIEYCDYIGKAEYDGDIVDGLPHGNGILKYYDGRCFEGEFANGRCHGFILYYIKDTDILKECEYQNGKSVICPEKISLRYEWRSSDCSLGGGSTITEKNTGTITPVLGKRLDIKGFRHIKVENITDEAVWFNGRDLQKGKSIYFEESIDGTELSDGTVINGTEYWMTIFWD